MLLQMTSAGAMGGGVASAIARALGAGRTREARALGVHALLIGVAMGFAFTLLAAIFAVIAFAMLVYGLFTGLAVLRSKWPTER